MIEISIIFIENIIIMANWCGVSKLTDAAHNINNGIVPYSIWE